MRVLVADDEAAMTRALEALLKREHYSVDVVNNGQDALDYGLAENYDALVLDIMMPKLDGLQVLTALREQGVATPVLLLTAKSQIEDRVAGLTGGADDYLPKPFDPREFVARVGALTRRGGAYTPKPSHRRQHHPESLHLRAGRRKRFRAPEQQGISNAGAADAAKGTADLHRAIHGAHLGL